VDPLAIAASLGLAPVGATRLTGGEFAAVHRVDLADGSAVVVKVAPPDGPALLSYERGLAAAEADYLALVSREAPEVPVPRLVGRGPGWLVSSFLPGTSIRGLPAVGARRELGAALARLHQVTGPHFGYPGGRVSGPSARSTYLAIIDELLADAARFGVVVPPDLRPLVGSASAALVAVTRPALLHFDLWDGNVLAEGDRLTGLVDGERWLWGDPLQDLVSPALGRRIEEEPDHPVLAGYGPVHLDPVRLTLHRIHLYLIMLVEIPGRGSPQSRADWVRGLLDSELATLG
jgi:aminoglycoside phosphotransferase (APT) family kinase protein